MATPNSCHSVHRPTKIYSNNAAVHLLNLAQCMSSDRTTGDYTLKATQGIRGARSEFVVASVVLGATTFAITFHTHRI